MSKKRILIIDDEEDTLTLLDTRLKSAGYEVLKARDGKQGLEAIEHERPDMVLLDVMMPVMGGYSMLQVLKERAQDRRQAKSGPPIIVITGKGEGVRDLFEMEGVCGYFVKPLDSKALLEKIKETFEDREVK